MKVKNSYSILGYLWLVVSFIRTKLINSKIRMIRFPFDLRGKSHIDFGENLTIGVGCRIEAFAERGKKVIHFGKNVQMNDYVHITAMNEIRIGDNVLMASKIYLSDCSHGSYAGDENDSSPLSIPMKRNYTVKKVIIENNVWIGEFVSVLPGVTIGEGSIIGTMSVVSKSIPPFCIAVGCPAKPIKKFNFETQQWEKII